MLAEYEIFVRALEEGSLSAAARRLDLSPAVASRRLARLEDRLGVRLIERTSRRLAPTEAGRLVYDRAAQLLEGVEDLEAVVSRRTTQARGLLRVSAPTSFGRRRLAPLLQPFLAAQPRLTLELNLTDAFVDLMAEDVDVAVRIGGYEAADPLMHRLAPNRRVLCASPAYLAEHGAPESLDDLRRHAQLAAENQSTWRLEGPEGAVVFRARSRVRTNSSEVARELALAGVGVALRSTWDVGDELRDGRLQVVLPQYAGSSDVAIFALTAGRARAETRVRAFIDFLSGLYGDVPEWDR
ncbi:MAG: LysR family transcriptional regulator [Brevundimonas sp.]|jgi:DNA-binding transcriptional LysR family regulator|uniref:LysR family transcriptional regulator n=1 Tax=Brevundimonas TaxID=41275 RepID=UPI0025C6C5B1|nr:LysR family transcriptional regulator [Brevundimonas sp.]MCH4267660.1 LysR family transcriptional regulator [Brevundimonas sp.]